jgi:hypothetical protein
MLNVLRGHLTVFRVSAYLNSGGPHTQNTNFTALQPLMDVVSAPRLNEVVETLMTVENTVNTIV